MSYWLKICVLAIASLSIMACASSETSESAGQYLDSSVLTAEVKTRLVAKLDGMQGAGIKVKSYKGHVQLSGYADNQAIVDKAGKIATNVAGAGNVTNDIIVK